MPFSFIYLIKASKIWPIEVNFGHKETTNGFKAQMKDEIKLINILCKIVSSQQYFITVWRNYSVYQLKAFKNKIFTIGIFIIILVNLN